ncbi:ylyB [Symbiodinium necroappetens]|uniref:YlyB protein n=1 Tax=Symbiodinium necroappetens TaxID=1628268 RepID=A0A812PEA1_9DINO|nr:ylyB [Symbiodinium necroappetens]
MNSRWRRQALALHGYESWTTDVLVACCSPRKPSATQLAHCAWTVAKRAHLGHNISHEFLQNLIYACQFRAAQFTDHELQCTLWAVGILRAQDNKVLSHLAKESMQRLQRDAPSALQRKSSGVGNVFWVMAKSHVFTGDLATHMVLQVAPLMPALSPRDLAGMCWACAFAQHVDAPLFFAISRTCDVSKLAGFSGQQLANLAWAFARVHSSWHGQLSISAWFWAAIVKNLAFFKPHEFSITLWAVAKLGLPENAKMQDFHLVERVGAQRLREGQFGPQELSNLSCAVARLFVSHIGSGDITLLSMLVMIARERMMELQPQHLANMMWSLGHARFAHKPFLRDVLDLMDVRGPTFATIELVGLVWSFARLHVSVAPSLLAQASEMLLSASQELTGQCVANVVWSLAILSCSSIADQWIQPVSTVLELGNCNPQELSNTAWAMMRLRVLKHIPIKLIASAFTGNVDSFNSQNISNLVLAFARVGCDGSYNGCSVAPFWTAAMHATTARTTEFNTQELANLCWSFAAMKKTSALSSIANEFVRREHEEADQASMLAMLWGLSFAGVRHFALFRRVRHYLVSRGKKLDTKRDTQLHRILPLGVAATNAGKFDHGEPVIAAELLDIIVLAKPPGWEVERHTLHTEPPLDDPLDDHLFQLKWFLISLARPSAIWFDRSHHFGFLHRLDIPGSGLILVAKTYEAYYWLLVQLNANRIVRDYVVLCHGWVSQARRTVATPIHWTPGHPAPSQVTSGGKPSVTNIRVVAHVHRASEWYTLLAVRIGTGRTHQIRAHAAHIGHPTVSDGKYTSNRTFRQDLQWCPRNFLHRYKLKFQGLEPPRRLQVVQPLPSDLRAALEQLQPADAGSAIALHSLALNGVPPAT